MLLPSACMQSSRNCSRALMARRLVIPNQLQAVTEIGHGSQDLISVK